MFEQSREAFNAGGKEHVVGFDFPAKARHDAHRRMERIFVNAERRRRRRGMRRTRRGMRRTRRKRRWKSRRRVMMMMMIAAYSRALLRKCSS